MKLLLALCLFVSWHAQAEDFRINETVNDSRARHEAERYQQYQQNNYQTPLGGYGDKLGDPAPYGTQSPSNNYNQQINSDWRTKAKSPY